MRRSWFTIACAFWAPAALAQDHLTPPEGIESYQTLVRHVLHEAFAEDVSARVIIEPSFSPETAVGLRRRGDGYQLFTVSPALHLWTYELIPMMERGLEGVSPAIKDRQSRNIKRLKAGVPARPEDVSLERCAVKIDEKMAADLLEAWSVMLKSVRPEDPNSDIIVDGVSFYFSMPDKSGELWGQAHSPQESSRAGKLVGAATVLAQYCETRLKRDLRRASELARQVVHYPEEESDGASSDRQPKMAK